MSVTCLATDASLTADPGVTSSIPAQSNTFLEIDHEIISTVIILPSAETFKKCCCQLQAKVRVRINVFIFGIHGNQSSNIIAKLEKCLTLRNKMTDKHKCVDISLYSIRSIDANLKSCTHASLVLCLNLVSMAT